MGYDKEFRFFDTGNLVDGNLELILVTKQPANPSKGYVPAYGFEMISINQNTNMGNIWLRIGNIETIEKYAGHIGYGVALEYRGNRYAARSCKLILSLAQKHGINPIWITCNPDNHASRRTCEIIGSKFVDTVTIPQDTELYEKGDRLKCRYRVDS